jgi:nucleoid-associated protein YgaU
MPNDAKLGLVFGVGLVIAVGVLFHRKDAPAGSPAAIDQVSPAAPGSSAAKAITPAKTTSLRRHTVQAGETLTSLAKTYLGDEQKVAAIREVNPTLQPSGDLAAGTELVIPEASPSAP